MRNTENRGVCVFLALGGVYVAKNISQALSEYVKNHNFDYGDVPAESVMDFLYIAYSDIGKKDNAEIEQGFIRLDRLLEGKSFEETEAIFNTVCDLCIAYEQRAFTDGLRLGAQLMSELQA